MRLSPCTDSISGILGTFLVQRSILWLEGPDYWMLTKSGCDQGHEPPENEALAQVSSASSKEIRTKEGIHSLIKTSSE